MCQVDITSVRQSLFVNTFKAFDDEGWTESGEDAQFDHWFLFL